MPDPILTVILAVKNAQQKQLYGCVSSVASLLYSKQIALIIVASGACPDLLGEHVAALNSVTVIASEPRGVYSAYNRGLDEKPSGYVLFLGVDDLALPGLDRALEFILNSDARPELIAACSFRQDIGLARPGKSRVSLILRNWCQQGLLYHSRLFESARFEIDYLVRADHKFNIELTGNRQNRVVYLPDVITHFASGGFSSQVVDRKFIANMPQIVRHSYGILFWMVALMVRELKWHKWRRPQ